MKLDHVSNTLRPDGPAMAALRVELEEMMKQSLAYLVAEAAPLPDAIAGACTVQLGRLHSASVDPVLFGLTAALRDAALADDLDELDRLRAVFATWDLAPSHPPQAGINPYVTVLGEENYDSARIALLTGLYADDVGLTTRLIAPPADAVSTERPLIRRASDIIAEAAPHWFDEFNQLVSEVVLAVNDQSVEGRNFAGGSTFDLFGTILVNPTYRSGVAHYLMTLIHESSHQRLFCHHLDDEVVLNAPEERFTSPLRRQLRPMEGVFHAMWVSARMAAFGTELLACPTIHFLLDAEERSALEGEVQSARLAFSDAHDVVKTHGMLTPLGQRLVDDAAEALGEVLGGR